MKIQLQFSGGMELLFNNQRVIDIALPASIINLADLLAYTRDTFCTGNKDLFMAADTIRPGVLVLINDADWELEGEGAYVVQEGDKIVFISTLHGG